MFNLTAWLRQHLHGDKTIWLVVALLSLISMAGVYSSIFTLAFKKMGGNTEFYLLKHGALMALGLACMFFAHKINYRNYAKLSLVGMMVSIPLLVWVIAKGQAINDASRWLTIPIINLTFQPSDLAKLSLITYVATFLAKRQRTIDQMTKAEFLPLLGWIGVLTALIIRENVSTGLILGTSCAVLMFIGRVPAKHMAMLAGAGVILIIGVLLFSPRAKTAIGRISRKYGVETTLKERIKDQKEFQSVHGLIAIANGGLFGVGPGKSMQKNVVPHPYSDFIFAILVEEYGMIGGLVIVGLYMTLLWRGMQAVRRSKDAFAGLLSAGLTVSLVLQAMAHFAVVLDLGPVTGQPLPLVSMGGTSLLFTGLSLGIIQSVSRDGLEEDFEPEPSLA